MASNRKNKVKRPTHNPSPVVELFVRLAIGAIFSSIFDIVETEKEKRKTKRQQPPKPGEYIHFEEV